MTFKSQRRLAMMHIIPVKHENGSYFRYPDGFQSVAIKFVIRDEIIVVPRGSSTGWIYFSFRVMEKIR